MEKTEQARRDAATSAERAAEAVTAMVGLAWWVSRRWPTKILSQKQFVVLTALEQWPSLPPIQADLALYLEDQASGVSRTIDGLVRRGFVETRRHGHLRVTKAGIAQLEACRSRVVQQASRRLRRLPVDDQRALIQVVRVLSEWKASGLAI